MTTTSAAVPEWALRGLPSVGDPAPDFALDNQYGQPVTLSALRGGPVLVVFYPFAFSPICSSELGQLRDELPSFPAGTRILAISVDSKYSLRSYAAAQELPFDLLADFWPHGDVARSYGVLDLERGTARRGTFVLDQAGVVRDVIAAESGTARPLAAYHDALAQL